jgi:predicted nucleic acid-binding protein
MPIGLYSHGPLLPRAFDLAREHDLTVYDGLYLALAVEFGAVMFTADQNLSNVCARVNLR